MERKYESGNNDYSPSKLAKGADDGFKGSTSSIDDQYSADEKDEYRNPQTSSRSADRGGKQGSTCRVQALIVDGTFYMIKFVSFQQNLNYSQR